MMTNIKTYSELITIPTFEERFQYLKIGGTVGEETFGFNRYLNQMIYRSQEWKRFRRDIIARDLGCDLGIEGRELHEAITVHHIEPITVDDIINKRYDIIFNPENAMSASDITHKAIHYGDEDLLVKGPVERFPYDTCPWKCNR